MTTSTSISPVPSFALLRGLEPSAFTPSGRRPIAALSFEFTTIAREVARRALGQLARRGRYRLNFALGEGQRLAFDSDIAPDAMAAYLDSLPHAANSGDVYARLNT